MNLKFMYFGCMCEWPVSYFRNAGHGTINAVTLAKQYEGKFKILLNQLNGDNLKDYYFFIIANYQQEYWQEHLDRYDIRKYIHFESETTASNYNHPSDGPKLKVYILKFPEDYVYKEPV